MAIASEGQHESLSKGVICILRTTPEHLRSVIDLLSYLCGNRPKMEDRLPEEGCKLAIWIIKEQSAGTAFVLWEDGHGLY